MKYKYSVIILIQCAFLSTINYFNSLKLTKQKKSKLYFICIFLFFWRCPSALYGPAVPVARAAMEWAL